ncbi:MAG: hypothetical protein R2783_05560 [Gelidibacter sp.]
MNLLKKATNAIFLTVFVLTAFNCSSPKQMISQDKPVSKIALQNKPVFKIDQIQFQEWYAGIKVGGTGFNIFLPNITNDENVVLETVYFRNLKGKLVKGKGMYSAILKNSSPYYTWEYPEKPADYPFDLTPNECVISYNENGETKYIKIAALTEKAGTYYENGPPSIYENEPSSVIATVEED